MDDLAGVGEAGHRDRDVRPVGAHLGADLADLVAAQAAGALGRRREMVPQDPAAPRDHLLGGEHGGGGAVEVRANAVRGQDGAGHHLGIRDGSDHGVRAETSVPDDVHPTQAGGGPRLVRGAEPGAAPLVGGDPVRVVVVRVDGGAGGADDGVEREVHELAGAVGGAPAGVVRAELGAFAPQSGAVVRDGREQLEDLDPLGAHRVDVLLGGRHERLGPPVHQRHVLHAGQAARRAGAVHRDVAGPDDGDPPAGERAAAVGGGQEVQGVDDVLATLAHRARAAAPGPGGHDHAVEAGAQLGEVVIGVAAEVEHHARGLGEAEVAPDLLRRDAEARDDAGHDSVRPHRLLEHLDVQAVAPQEQRRGDAGRAGADDGDARHRAQRGRDDRAHVGLLGGVRGGELHAADVDRGVVVHARAVIPARLRAQHPGDGGCRVVPGDELEGLGVPLLRHEGEVFRDLLLDGAAAMLAGGLEAVGERQWGRGLPGAHLLAVALVDPLVGQHAGHEGVQGGDVDPVGVTHGGGGEAGELGQAGVAAGLQQGGRDRDRLDPGGQDVRDVRGVRAP